MNGSTFTKSLLAAAVLCVGAAQATPVTWTLQGVTFSDGATASGWFSYDADTHVSSAFNLSTSSGTELDAFSYNAANSHFFDNAYLPASVSWFSNSGTPYLSLLALAPLTNAGGTLDLSGASYECTNCMNFRTVTGGTITSVPEPATYSLLLAGAGLMGLLARRRRA
jgi:hypothetical protein